MKSPVLPIACLTLTCLAIAAGCQSSSQPGPLVGDQAPDFEVEIRGGQRMRLSDHLASAPGPTILLFSRAHW